MLAKVYEALRRKQDAGESDEINVKVYVTPNGSVYVKGHELAHNAAWRAKVNKLIDADLMGRNEQEHSD